MITKITPLIFALLIAQASTALANPKGKFCPDDDPLGILDGNEGCEIVKHTSTAKTGIYTLFETKNGNLLLLNTQTGEVAIFKEDKMRFSIISNDRVSIKVGQIYELEDGNNENKYVRYQGSGKFESLSILEVADEIIKVDY